jgi:hypothetical protein
MNKLKADNILYSFEWFSARYGSGECAIPISLPDLSGKE